MAKSYKFWQRVIVTTAIVVVILVAGYVAWKPQFDHWVVTKLAAQSGIDILSTESPNIGLTRFTAAKLFTEIKTGATDFDVALSNVAIDYRPISGQINEINIGTARIVSTLKATPHEDTGSTGTTVFDLPSGAQLHAMLREFAPPGSLGEIVDLHVDLTLGGTKTEYRGALNWRQETGGTVFTLQSASEVIRLSLNAAGEAIGVELTADGNQTPVMSMSLGTLHEPQSELRARANLGSLGEWLNASPWLPHAYKNLATQTLTEQQLDTATVNLETAFASAHSPLSPQAYDGANIRLAFSDVIVNECRLLGEFKATSRVAASDIQLTIADDSRVELTGCGFGRLPGTVETLAIDFDRDTRFTARLATQMKDFAESAELQGAMTVALRHPTGGANIVVDHISARVFDPENGIPEEVQSEFGIDMTLDDIDLGFVAFRSADAKGKWYVSKKPGKLTLRALEQQSVEVTDLQGLASVHHLLGTPLLAQLGIAKGTILESNVDKDAAVNIRIIGNQHFTVHNSSVDYAKVTLGNWEINDWRVGENLPEKVDVPFKVEADLPLAALDDVAIKQGKFTLNAHLQGEAPAPLQLSILPNSIFSAGQLEITPTEALDGMVSGPILLELGGDLAYDTLKSNAYKISGNAVARIPSFELASLDGNSLVELNQVMIGTQIKDTGQAPQLTLRYTAEALTAPALDLTTNQIHGNGNIDLRTLVFDGVTAVSGIRQNSWPQALPPVALRAEFRGNRNHYNLTGSATVAPGMTATLSADSKQNRAIAELNAGANEFVAWIRSMYTFPDPSLNVNSGVTTTRGVWNIDDMTGLLTFQSEGLSGAYEDVLFQGGQIRVEVTNPTENQARFDITIPRGQLANNIPFSTLRSTGAMSGDTLTLRQASMGLLGGTLLIKNIETSIEKPQFNFPIALDNVDLGALVSYFENEDIDATGRLSGQLPLKFVDGKLSIEDGRLESETGGVIRYQPKPGAIPKDVDNIALQALENFEYEKLSVSINYQANGEYRIRLRLEGSNQALYDGYPIAFNVNLNGILPGFIQASLIGGKFEEQIFDELRKKQPQEPGS